MSKENKELQSYQTEKIDYSKERPENPELALDNLAQNTEKTIDNYEKNYRMIAGLEGLFDENPNNTQEFLKILDKHIPISETV